MEPLTRRMALHFYTDLVDECLDFYSRLLSFTIVKDLEMANGRRWATVAKSDNLGIQLHFHPIKPDLDRGSPIQIEFSHPDPWSLRDNLSSNGFEVTEWELPYAWGIECSDPLGNRITLSFWGNEEHDLDNGYEDHVTGTGNAE